MLDTPGVYPYKEKDKLKHALISSIDYSKIKDSETVALRLIESLHNKIEEHYNVKAKEPEQLLEKIAIKLNLIKKGNKPDTERAARKLLKDWQKGILNGIKSSRLRYLRPASRKTPSTLPSAAWCWNICPIPSRP